jgi:hypothetical protein
MRSIEKSSDVIGNRTATFRVRSSRKSGRSNDGAVAEMVTAYISVENPDDEKVF